MVVSNWRARDGAFELRGGFCSVLPATAHEMCALQAEGQRLIRSPLATRELVGWSGRPQSDGPAGGAAFECLNRVRVEALDDEPDSERELEERDEKC